MQVLTWNLQEAPGLRHSKASTWYTGVDSRKEILKNKRTYCRPGRWDSKALNHYFQAEEDFPGILETGNITPGMSTARPAGHAGSTGITSIGGGSCGTGSTDRTGRTDRTGSTAGTGKTGDADKTSDTAGTGNETYDPGLVSNRIQAFNGLISTMRKAADGQDVNPVWKDVYIWFMNNEKMA